MKGRENGVAEFVDYESSLTKEQRKEREKILLNYKQIFEVITNQ